VPPLIVPLRPVARRSPPRLFRAAQGISLAGVIFFIVVVIVVATWR
jgi:hypothetical protein